MGPASQAACGPKTINKSGGQTAQSKNNDAETNGCNAVVRQTGTCERDGRFRRGCSAEEICGGFRSCLCKINRSTEQTDKRQAVDATPLNGGH